MSTSIVENLFVELYPNSLDAVESVANTERNCFRLDV